MDIAKFYSIVSSLKNEKRAGWVERGVVDPETTSSHSFMSALLSLLLVPRGLDKERVIKMMLVHDIAESVTGDMITKENWKEGGTIRESEKLILERKATERIVSSLDDREASEIVSLWEEFEENKTPEAMFANDMDVFERTMQALEYHKQNNFKKPLEPFWDSKNLGKIRDRRLKGILAEMIEDAM